MSVKSIRSIPSISSISALLLALLLTSCSSGSNGGETGPAAELREARGKWEKVSPENYTFQFRWQCFCMVEYVSLVELNVEGGEIVSGRYVEGDSALSSSRLADYAPIDELFDVIQDAIDRDAHSIEAKYDPELGYPVDVYIDYNEMMADEERGFTVGAFNQ